MTHRFIENVFKFILGKHRMSLSVLSESLIADLNIELVITATRAGKHIRLWVRFKNAYELLNLTVLKL